MKHKITITTFDENGDEQELSLPARWHICPTCRGEGKSSAYLGAYTAEEMDEAGRDFQEDYMSGFYDRSCDDCNGAGKVLDYDWPRLTRAERKIVNDARRVDAELRAEEEAERRAGC